MKTKFFLLAFAIVCFKMVDYLPVPQETGYTQKQRIAMNNLVERVTAKTKPVVLYHTQAERDQAIASIFMAGRE